MPQVELLTQWGTFFTSYIFTGTSPRRRAKRVDPPSPELPSMHLPLETPEAFSRHHLSLINAQHAISPQHAARPIYAPFYVHKLGKKCPTTLTNMPRLNEGVEMSSWTKDLLYSCLSVFPSRILGDTTSSVFPPEDYSLRIF